MVDVEKVIRSFKACAHHPDHDCESCDYCDNNFWCYNDLLIEDLEKVLKKHIPMTPETDEMKNYRCPDCGAVVGRSKYCQECGQALKYEH